MTVSIAPLAFPGSVTPNAKGHHAADFAVGVERQPHGHLLVRVARAEGGALELLALHANCFLTKPMDLEDFQRVVAPSSDSGCGR